MSKDERRQDDAELTLMMSFHDGCEVVFDATFFGAAFFGAEDFDFEAEAVDTGAAADDMLELAEG